MNRFYVVEGNKRVSVLKYFDAVSIAAHVTRIVPRRTDTLESKIYFEFLDFYRITGINYVWFTKEGNFQKLLDILQKTKRPTGIGILQGLSLSLLPFPQGLHGQRREKTFYFHRGRHVRIPKGFWV